MKKNKYNNGSSMPISGLSKDELKVAMKEWAEGSETLEKLLWNCYNNGIETGGCHIGNGNAYLDFYSDSCTRIGREKVNKMLCKLQEFNNSQIYLSPDGGFPLSGHNWYRPACGIGIYNRNIEENNKIFERINYAMNSKEVINNKGQVFIEAYDFLDFFKDKESGVAIRAIHTKTDKYTIALEIYQTHPNASKVDGIFTKAGFILDKSTEDRPTVEWKIEEENPEILAEKIRKSKKVIFNEWDIKPTDEINKNMKMNTVAKIKKRQYGDTPLGKKRMDLWIKMQKTRINIMRIKSLYKKYKQKKIFASGLQNADRRLKEAEKKLEEKEHENDGKEK